MSENNNWVKWADSIGNQIIKEIKIEIPSGFIRRTTKKCIKCNTLFTYNHDDDTEKLHRLLYFNKTGNLDVCLDCDK